MSDQEPTVFSGRYELHRRLARGGMAEVFLARDQLLDRPVAVKVMFPEFAADPSFVERFRREAQSAANLNHPNIVGVYDWGQEGEQYFIVMEYVEGRSLSEILRSEGALLPERAADIAIDVAAALGFAHRNGVVNRDVKPGNILISQSGQVKVTDFGIARAVRAGVEDNLTQTGAVMGTATYFSPEQAQGRPVDPRSDVYSLGVVLYEMIAGRPPFTGDSAVTIAYKHVQEPPPPLRDLKPDLDPALEAIVLKALAKSTTNRYPSAEDLRADLRRYREGHRILADPTAAAAGAAGAAAAGPDATGVMPATTATPATQVEDVYDDEYDEPRRNGVFIAVLVVLLLILAGLLFALARTLGFGGDDEPEVAQVAVPNVIEMTLEEATLTLEAEGFEVNPEFEPNDDVPDDVVFDQDPVAGTRIDEGSTVTIRVSEGGELIPMPELIGLQEQQARQLLIDQGFTTPPVVEREFDEEAPEGEVIDQQPAVSQDVPLDAEVTLIVSDGPEDRPVPPVAGRSVSEATVILTEAGFQVTEAEEFSDTVPAGQVIGTDPPEGTELPKDSVVTIRVSRGIEQVTVPDVVGESRSAAISQLEAAGFEVDEQSTEGTADQVIDQDPNGETTAPRGSTVTIFVGDGTTSSTSSSIPDVGD